MNRLLRSLVVAVAVLAAAPTAAAPILTVGGATVPSGGSGTLGVSMTVPVGDPAVQLGGFSLDLSATGGLQFTGVAYPASDYVFAGGASFNQNNGVPFSLDPAMNPTVFPNAAFNAADLADGPLGFVTLLPGQTYNLATINFLAPQNSGATQQVLPVTLLNTTALADELGGPVAATLVGGSVTVLGVERATAVVPEPATLAVFAAVAIAAWAGRASACSLRHSRG